jgi:hypothetical protein
MFDPDTVALMAQAPPLEGLDLARLPQDLTEVYAEIVTARIRLRELASGQVLPDTVRNSIKTMRRLASAQEAFVSTLPDREDRSAAAFVAASAHHVCMLADAAATGIENNTEVRAGKSPSPARKPDSARALPGARDLSPQAGRGKA